MRNGLASVRIAGVAHSGRKVTIGIELGSGQPISGTLTADAGDPTPFNGWIQLVASLQEAMAEADVPERPEEDSR